MLERFIQKTFLAHILLALSALFSSVSLWRFLVKEQDKLHDFGAFWASGLLLRTGQDPYSYHPLMTLTSLRHLSLENVFLNPPPVLAISWLFSLVDLHMGRNIWVVIDTLFIVFAIALLMRRYGGTMTWIKVAILVVSPIVTHSIALIQIYGLLALICTIAWLDLTDGKTTRAGILLGIAITIKPLLLVWPALMFFAGYRRPALFAGAVFLAANLIALAVLGPDVFVRWFDVVSHQESRLLMLTNLSLFMPFAHIGDLATPKILAGLVLVSLAFWAWRSRPPIETVMTIALLAALFCSPLAWFRYLIFALPVFFWLRWTPLMTTAIVLFSLPVAFVQGIMKELIELPAFIAYAYYAGFILLMIDMIWRLMISPKRITKTEPSRSMNILPAVQA